jgi:chromosome partitioning protein
MPFFSKRTETTQRGANSARVISFLNQKGGVGKTTMAFNTAHALKALGLKVLCIDLDPQANLSFLFGSESSEDEQLHIFHLLINSVRELKTMHSSASLDDILIKGEVDVLPSGQALSGFELSVAGVNAARQLILRRFLERSGLLDRYDQIIIDCPPTLGLLVVNALCASDGVMVPFRPDEFSRKGLSHLSEVLENIEDMGVSQIPEVVAYIPNLVDTRRKQEKSDLENIKKGLGISAKGVPVVAPFFNRAPLVKSQSQRKSVFDYQSKEFDGLKKSFTDVAQLIQKWGVRYGDEKF